VNNLVFIFDYTVSLEICVLFPITWSAVIAALRYISSDPTDRSIEIMTIDTGI